MTVFCPDLPRVELPLQAKVAERQNTTCCLALQMTSFATSNTRQARLSTRCNRKDVAIVVTMCSRGKLRAEKDGMRRHANLKNKQDEKYESKTRLVTQSWGGRLQDANEAAVEVICHTSAPPPNDPDSAPEEWPAGTPDMKAKQTKT